MIVVDTGVLYAAADRDDSGHHDSADLLIARAAELIVPVPVIIESAWMIESRIGPKAEAGFLRHAAADLARIDLTDADWTRVAALIDTYADLGLGTVDASVVAIAERFRVLTVATLNHRDFTVVRPAHCNAFELVP